MSRYIINILASQELNEIADRFAATLPSLPKVRQVQTDRRIDKAASRVTDTDLSLGWVLLFAPAGN